MKYGIELVREEREEQLNKHGFTNEHDFRVYNNSRQLAQASTYLLHRYLQNNPIEEMPGTYPSSWDNDSKNKFDTKEGVELLKVAAALLVAEIDRVQNSDK